MTLQQRPFNASGFVFGLMVMLTGVAFLLAELGVMDWRVGWHYWPLIIVAMGIAKLLEIRKDGTREGGFLVFVGVWLLLNQTGVLRWRDSWPLVIVAIGVSMTWQALTGKPRRLCDAGDGPAPPAAQNQSHAGRAADAAPRAE